VVALVEACGDAPTLVEYMEEGWTRPQLLALFAAADLTPRTALRETKSPAKELGLLDSAISDDMILQHMLLYPVLVNRPIVCTPRGVRLCRPSETVLSLLDHIPTEPFRKEDGTQLDVTRFRSVSP
jgi:arsenate reductase (glutaredoxin)